MSASDVAPNPLFSHPFEQPQQPLLEPFLESQEQVQPLNRGIPTVQDADMENGEDTAGTPRSADSPAPPPNPSNFHEDLNEPPAPPPPPVAPPEQDAEQAPPVENGEDQHNDSSESDDEGSHSGEEDEDDEDKPPASQWQAIEEDTSTPCEDEVTYIEAREEHSASDHAHWEKETFFDLDDPELVPGACGRIDWTVEHFNGTKEDPNKELIMRSPAVKIGDMEWQIKFFPKGNGGEFLSAYIECVSMTQPDFREQDDFDRPPLPVLSGQPALTKRRSVAAQVSIVMYNPTEPRVNEFKCDAHQFHKQNADFGWRYFSYEPRYVFHQRRHGQRQAILRNDKLAFSAYIRLITDPTGCMWEHGLHAAEESISITGLRPFNGQLASDAAVLPLLHFKPFREFLATVHAGGSKEIQSLQQKLQKMILRKPSRQRSSRHYSRKSGEHLSDCVLVLQRLRDVFHARGCGEKLDELLGNLKSGCSSSRLKQDGSVQSAIDHHKTLNTPPLLSLELERQRFTEERKWKKLTHKVAMENLIEVGGRAYVLFAFVTHTGHLQSGTYTAYIRPGGVGERWYAYEDNRVKCLTHNQAMNSNCGFESRRNSLDDGLAGGMGSDEVAYLVYYVRDDFVLDLHKEEALKLLLPAKDETVTDDTAKVKSDPEKAAADSDSRPLVRLDTVLQEDAVTNGDHQIGSTNLVDGDDVVMSDAETDSSPTTHLNGALLSSKSASEGVETDEVEDKASLPSTPVPVTIDYFSREYFDGFYLDGKPHGQGHLITVEGDEYKGDFKNGRYHGKGTMVYAKDGKTYEGDWQDGQRNGQGKLMEKNRCYEGGWQNDQQKGKFVLTGEVTDDDKGCCQICYISTLNTAFYDCGHVMACKDCATKIDSCPVCRRRVLARIELFGVKVSLD